jgi:hypothetical protein
VRYAARTLGKSPGLVIVTVRCLGVGIGVNTTIYRARRGGNQCRPGGAVLLALPLRNVLAGANAADPVVLTVVPGVNSSLTLAPTQRSVEPLHDRP